MCTDRTDRTHPIPDTWPQCVHCTPFALLFIRNYQMITYVLHTHLNALSCIKHTVTTAEHKAQKESKMILLFFFFVYLWFSLSLVARSSVLSRLGAVALKL